MKDDLQQFHTAAISKAARLFSELGRGYMTHDIEDLRQELLLVAWLANSSYRPDRLCSLNTWVNRKMDYFILDYKREYIKRRVKLEYVGDLFDLQKIIDARGAHPAHGSGLINMEELGEHMDERMKTVLALYLDGYTQKEIAHQLDYSDNSGVARQLLRIRQIISRMLRNKLNGIGDNGNLN